MRYDVQPGHTITVTAPYDVDSDDGVLVGSIFGVATHKAASGAPLELKVEGVVQIKKTAAVTFTQGAKVSWDNTTKLTLAPATGFFSGTFTPNCENPAARVKVVPPSRCTISRGRLVSTNTGA